MAGAFLSFAPASPWKQKSLLQDLLEHIHDKELVSAKSAVWGGALEGHGKQVIDKKKGDPSPVETESLMCLKPKAAQPSLGTFPQGSMQDAGDTGDQNIPVPALRELATRGHPTILSGRGGVL